MGTSGLGALLVKEGLLSSQDRSILGKSTGHQAWAFAKGVLASGLLDETELASLLAERTTFTVAPRNFLAATESDALAAIDVNLMQELEVYPLKISGQTLTVAMCDPLDKTAWNQLAFFTGLKIKPVIATLTDIRAALKRLNPHYQPHASEFESFFRNHAQAASRQQRARHQTSKPQTAASNAADLLPDEPVVKKASFPKLEDLPSLSQSSPSEPMMADDNFEAAGEVALDDLPPIDGDSEADLSLEGAALEDVPIEDLPLEEAAVAAAPVGEDDESLAAMDPADSSDLDFDLGGNSPDLELDLPETTEAGGALDAVEVDELVAEGTPDFGLPDEGLASDAPDLGLGESLVGDIPIEKDVGDDLTEQVVFHPAMSDINQALLYLSFASSPEQAYAHAAKGWMDVIPYGVVYEVQGKAAFPRFTWENGTPNTSDLADYDAPSAQEIAKAVTSASWLDVSAAEPFSHWAKAGKLVGCAAGDETRFVVIAAPKEETWQIEGFPQAALALFQALAQKMALPSPLGERRVAD